MLNGYETIAASLLLLKQLTTSSLKTTKKRHTCSKTRITVDLPFPDGMSIRVSLPNCSASSLKSNLSQDCPEAWTLRVEVLRRGGLQGRLICLTFVFGGNLCS